jgi:hypothetical protein
VFDSDSYPQIMGSSDGRARAITRTDRPVARIPQVVGRSIQIGYLGSMDGQVPTPMPSPDEPAMGALPPPTPTSPTSPTWAAPTTSVALTTAGTPPSPPHRRRRVALVGSALLGVVALGVVAVVVGLGSDDEATTAPSSTTLLAVTTTEAPAVTSTDAPTTGVPATAPATTSPATTSAPTTVAFSIPGTVVSATTSTTPSSATDPTDPSGTDPSSTGPASTDSSTPSTVPLPDELQSAVDETNAEPLLHTRMTMVGPTAAKVDVVVDRRSALIHETVTGRLATTGAKLTLEIFFEPRRNTMYMSAATLASFGGAGAPKLPPGIRWVSIDASLLDGTDLSGLLPEDGSGMSVVPSAGVTDVEDIGGMVVSGVPGHRFRLTIDPKAVVASLPGLGGLLPSLPSVQETSLVDVAGGTVRRITATATGSHGTEQSVTEVLPSDPSQHVTLPPAKQIIDVTDLG